MKKTKLMTLGFLLLISIFIALYYGSIKHTSYVSEGVIDVGPYLNNGEVIALDGMWSFYPDELLEPSDFRNEGQSGTNSLQVPLAWGKAENAKSRGCGTYRLVLNNLEPNKQYGLIKKNIRIASKIFIDGRLLFQDGVPAVNEHGETMGNMPGIIGFESMDSTAEIIIQTSNFKYYSGGIVESIRLGSIADAEQECRENIIFDTMILTIITVIGVLLTILVVFFREFRKEEPEGYYLPITVLSFGIVNGALGERVIKLIVPGISTELLIRIEYVAVSLMLISLFLIIHVMDKRLLPKIGVYVLSLVYGVFLIAAIFSPMRYHLLLQLVGENLKDMVRAGDFVARLGGDEFVILLSNVADDASCKKICDKIITTLSEPTSVKDHTVNIGVSIGVAYFPTHGKTSNALVKSADNAMYVAKENGKNRYVFAAL